MLLEPVFLEGKTQGRDPMLVLNYAILCFDFFLAKEDMLIFC